MIFLNLIFNKQNINKLINNLRIYINRVETFGKLPISTFYRSQIKSN